MTTTKTKRDNKTINDLFGTIVEFYNRWDEGETTPKENRQLIMDIKKMLENY